MYVRFIKERVFMGMINVRDYNIQLPPKTAEDVVKATLTLDQSGHEKLPLTFERSIELGGQFPPEIPVTVVEGLDIKMTLTFTDNAGNVGPASEAGFSSKDDTAPPAPGEFGATFVSERVVDEDSL